MEKLELLFLPSPGVGHLISTVELARRFHEKHHFSFTILLIPLQSPALPSKITSYVQSITASYPDIRFIHLPLIDLPFETDLNSNTFLSLLMEKYKSNVKETIKKLQSSSSSSSTHITALILDLFATTMIDVGVELGIPTYIYFTSGAAALGLLLYLPTLHEKISCEYKDYHKELEVPGMLPLLPVVMPELMMNKKDDEYTWYVFHGRRFREVEGLIVNTFGELEPKALKALDRKPKSKFGSDTNSTTQIRLDLQGLIPDDYLSKKSMLSNKLPSLGTWKLKLLKKDFVIPPNMWVFGTMSHDRSTVASPTSNLQMFFP